MVNLFKRKTYFMYHQL